MALPMSYVNPINTPNGYVQMNPYALSPPVKTKTEADGGKTLWIIVGTIAGIVLVGMALGLGLGIGAAGILSSETLTPFNVTVVNETTTTTTTTTAMSSTIST